MHPITCARASAIRIGRPILRPLLSGFRVSLRRLLTDCPGVALVAPQCRITLLWLLLTAAIRRALVTRPRRIPLRTLLAAGTRIALLILLLPPLLRLPIALPVPERRIFAAAVLITAVSITLNTVISAAAVISVAEIPAVPVVPIFKSTIAVIGRRRIPRLRRCALRAAALSQRLHARNKKRQRCRCQERGAQSSRIGCRGHKSHSRLSAAHSQIANCRCPSG